MNLIRVGAPTRTTTCALPRHGFWKPRAQARHRPRQTNCPGSTRSHPSPTSGRPEVARTPARRRRAPPRSRGQSSGNSIFWGKFRRATESARAGLLSRREWAQRQIISSLVSDVATAYLPIARTGPRTRDLAPDACVAERLAAVDTTPCGPRRHVHAGRAAGRTTRGRRRGPDPRSRTAGRTAGELPRYRHRKKSRRHRSRSSAGRPATSTGGSRGSSVVAARNADRTSCRRSSSSWRRTHRLASPRQTTAGAPAMEISRRRDGGGNRRGDRGTGPRAVVCGEERAGVPPAHVPPLHGAGARFAPDGRDYSCTVPPGKAIPPSCLPATRPEHRGPVAATDVGRTLRPVLERGDGRGDRSARLRSGPGHARARVARGRAAASARERRSCRGLVAGRRGARSSPSPGTSRTFASRHQATRSRSFSIRSPVITRDRRCSPI